MIVLLSNCAAKHSCLSRDCVANLRQRGRVRQDSCHERRTVITHFDFSLVRRCGQRTNRRRDARALRFPHKGNPEYLLAAYTEFAEVRHVSR